nr:MAG TPA: hypothetical protein [Caudoviricetes sp.]DAL25303.1 MAG TPA_asm: hypothetical protein [Caudoviricetes sp.]
MSYFVSYKEKEKAQFSLETGLFLWRRWRDLNPHAKLCYCRKV